MNKTRTVPSRAPIGYAYELHSEIDPQSNLQGRDTSSYQYLVYLIDQPFRKLLEHDQDILHGYVLPLTSSSLLYVIVIRNRIEWQKILPYISKVSLYNKLITKSK